MWKFDVYSITHIFRNIKVGDSRSAKSFISTDWDALKFDFYEILNLLKAEIYQINKILSPYWKETAFLQLLDSLKVDFM